MSDFDTRVSSALAGSYTIERELGAGGMAIVYLATDLKHGRKVAVKVMRPELAETLGGERFLKEIETAANLNHPHILPVHDSGQVDGLLYFVMPFVDGESLADRIQREGPLPINEAVRLTREVADALAHAHDAGVIHRDIKPDNIMLYGGHAVIADFGIAKAADNPQAQQLTGTGISVGTPAYISPEQATADEVDGRSDIYSLGCMLYEMLVGQPPFTGRTAQAVIQQHVVAPPPAASDSRSSVPIGLSRAIEKALAKTPADRYTTATEFAEELSSFGSGGAADDTATMRLLQGMGVYAAVALFIYWLLDIFVNRFVWSPHLPAFGAVAWLTMSPVVALLVWRRVRGAPLKRTGLIGVPANVVGGAAVLWLLYGSTDLGAATTTVTVEDENGNTVERVIPKSEFRKNLLIFPVTNASGDSTLDWIQHGLPFMLDVDLEQDMFILARSTELLVDEYRDRGYPEGVGVPLTLQRELAEDQNVPMFLAGSYTRTNGQVEVTLRLYETDRSKLMAERTFAGESMVALVDEMSVALREDLGLPAQHIEDTPDLSLADQLTSSEEAIRQLAIANRLVAYEQDWAGAGEAVRRSLAIDSTNAYAHLIHYGISLFSNDRANALAAIEAAMQYLYKLPERSQFTVKFQYYDFNQEAEKALAVAEMRVDLFSDDIEGRLILAGLYELRDRTSDALEQYEAILQIDPTLTEHLRKMGFLAQGAGDYDLAARYLQEYANANPNDIESFTALAGLQRSQGNFEGAREAYERAALLEPGDVGVKISLATLERHLGRMEEGVAQLQRALEAAGSPQDSARVLASLRGLADERGRPNEAVTYLEQELALSQQFTPPIAVLSSRLGSLDAYVAAGRTDDARQILASVEQQLQAPFDQLGSLGRLMIAMESEDPDAIDAAIPGLEALINGLGIGQLRPVVLGAQAKSLELRGECADAIQVYGEAIAANPNATTLHRYVGRCHRILGDLDAAEESLQQRLTVAPYDPETLLELAKVFIDRGNTGDAVAQLETALDVWQGAEPGHRPSQEARQLLEEIQ